MQADARVHAALRRQPVDRVPIWMWYQPDTLRRLGELLEIPPAHVTDALGDDIRQAWVGNNSAMEGVVLQNNGDSFTDAWGIEWVKEGGFNQIRNEPLRGKSDAEVLDYRFPADCLPELMAPMERLVESAGGYFLGCDVSPCLFEMICRLRGMENAWMDLAASPDMAQSLYQKACEFSLKLAEAACRQFPLDWLWTGDDVGSQRDLMMSLACWRQHIRPHLARIFAVGKAHGLVVAYHSCGAIRRIIPDLIEIGLDVLNPIQGICPGMDPVELKREYGRDLAFMGGVDTQHLLPNGSAEEVYAETSRLLEAMTANGGGYILAASHTVPPETPLDNIFALYAAAGISRDEIFARAADSRQQQQVNPGNRVN